MTKKKTIINSSILLLLTVAGFFAVNFASNDANATKSAEQLGREIEALQRQIDASDEEANKLNQKAQTLQGELDGINKEKEIIINQIKISENQKKKLEIEIKETEKKIEENKSVLGKILVQMSIEDDVTPIERIASSENISEALDSFEYKNAMKDSLVVKLDQIKKDKQELDNKHAQVKVALVNQENSKKALQAKSEEQQKLIDETKGEEAAYHKYSAERKAQKAQKQQEQQQVIQAAIERARREAEARARSNGSPVQSYGVNLSSGKDSGYPWGGGNCTVDANAWSHGGADGNGTDGYGYGCRQCVSYTAWRLRVERGFIARNWGNANMWPANARAAGFRTGSTPRAGSLGVISAGLYGHIVWVESVEGSDVIISQYNYYNAGGPGWGHYSKMRVPASTYDTYIYV